MPFIFRVIHDLLYIHPPRTLFVHFPIALVSPALFFILMELWRKSDILEQIAFADISLAAVSTIFEPGLSGNLRKSLVFILTLLYNKSSLLRLAFCYRARRQYPINYSFGGVQPMKLNAPKLNTFYTAVIIAAVGVVVYLVHLFAKSIGYLQPVAFLLVVVAFVLLCLGMTMKGV